MTTQADYQAMLANAQADVAKHWNDYVDSVGPARAQEKLMQAEIEAHPVVARERAATRAWSNACALVEKLEEIIKTPKP